jgi:spermidine synthase
MDDRTNQMIRELDYQKTSLGELVLRCRRSPRVPGGLVYEVKLNDEMLMSSSVNASEQALARLVLDARARHAQPADVLIGGLGLGYTAAAALEYPQVRRVDVIELLGPVIAWHRSRLVPAASQLMDDPRCFLIEGDFFAYVWAARPRFARRYDVILVDIDHSPDCCLHPSHGVLYSEPGIARLADCLHPGGVFGLWSADEPSAEFLERLASVFTSVCPHPVPFHNPHIGEIDTNWIVIAREPRPLSPVEMP